MAGACYFCEGMRLVPVFCAVNLPPQEPDECRVADETDSQLLALWHEAEKKEHAPDGWIHLPCPRCCVSNKR